MLITDFRSVSGILRILPGFASNATGAMSGWAAIRPRLAGRATPALADAPMQA